MKMLALARRNRKEILRDPLNFGFGLGFPLIVLFLLHTIQSNIPLSLFEIQTVTPGIAVFGFSFITLFSAALLAKDRGSALLQRLYTTPLMPMDFILGYMLPMLPMAVAQCCICYLAAVALGLSVTVRLFYAIVLMVPVALLFVALGLLCGSVFTDKQAGGICGALLTNLTAWMSGTWFDLKLMGTVLQKVAYALPFVHAVDMERAVLAGNYTEIWSHLWWILGYTVCIFAAAIVLFVRQMKYR